MRALNSSQKIAKIFQFSTEGGKPQPSTLTELGSTERGHVPLSETEARYNQVKIPAITYTRESLPLGSNLSTARPLRTAAKVVRKRIFTQLE